MSLQIIKNLAFLSFFCLYWSNDISLAQNIKFHLAQDIPVEINGKRLQNPWTGGLNAPQISTAFLNEDESPDLVVFDRTNNKVSTFLSKEGEDTFYYQYAPQYAFLFPKLSYWMLMRDYDQDGDKDIFAHHRLGIQVYQNLKTASSQPKWEQVKSPIFTEGYRGDINLQVPATDIPIIIDLDKDGDQDIITFDYIGERLELHQNLSQESGYENDSLLFCRINTCWGDFAEGQNCGEFYFDLNCEPIKKKKDKGGGNDSFPKPMHLGSSSLLLNLNGDKALDLLIGDVSCEEAYVFLNKKKNIEAAFTQTTQSIFDEHPILMPIFPAFFSEDVTFDGKNDLLVSPNVFINEGEGIDFSSSVWLYEQVGTEKKPEFEFQQNNFLQETTLDVGEDACPVLLDYDQDGDLDLFIGNGGELHSDGFYAQIYFFENIGDASMPHFQLVDKDFLSLSQKKVKRIQLQVQKLNSDDFPDLVLSFDSLGQKQTFYFPYQPQERHFSWENFQKYPIDLTPQESLMLFDINQDKVLDALLLNQTGNVRFLENQGTNLAPIWTEKTNQFLGIEQNSQKQNPHLILTDFQQDEILDILLIDDSGSLKTTALPFLLDSKPSFSENLIWNLLEQKGDNFYFGKKLSLTIGDLNADKIPDIVIGTNAGGLLVLTGSSN